MEARFGLPTLSRTVEVEMKIRFGGLSPGCSLKQRQRVEGVITFWNALSCSEDAGETTWGILEDLQARVSNCLCNDPLEVEQAESLTALAALLMSGERLL